MNAALAALFAADRREHADVPPVGTPAYRRLRARDAARRREASALLAAIPRPALADLYHAAWLFNHGDAPEEALRAYGLASAAAARGHGPAAWLAAAAFDRWCMYDGRPQRFGTQMVPDGARFRVWDTDPRTTDTERAALEVPPLGELADRADRLTRTAPQPPMTDAPAWLRAAIARWRGGEGR